MLAPRRQPCRERRDSQGTIAGMNIVILDDYQDAVRKLQCASKLEAYPAKVFTNTVKGIGQLSVRLRDADVIVLIRERTHITRQEAFDVLRNRPRHRTPQDPEGMQVRRLEAGEPTIDVSMAHADEVRAAHTRMEKDE